jgi:hypothetical protein
MMDLGVAMSETQQAAGSRPPEIEKENLGGFFCQDFARPRCNLGD